MSTNDPCGVCHGDGQVTDVTGLGMEPCGPCGGTGAAVYLPGRPIKETAMNTLLQAMRDELLWAEGLEDADECDGHDPKAFAEEVNRLIDLFEGLATHDSGEAECFLQEQQMSDGRWLFAQHSFDPESAAAGFETSVALARSFPDVPAIRVGKWALVGIPNLWERS